MAYLYKCYLDTKDVMIKYVNATEVSVIYGHRKTRIMTIAKEANAIYEVGNSALVNTVIIEEYLEKFREPSRPLPKYIYERFCAGDLKPSKSRGISRLWYPFLCISDKMNIKMQKKVGKKSQNVVDIVRVSEYNKNNNINGN